MEFHKNRVEITDTPEKFAGMCEQVAPVLLNLLSALADAEKKAHEDFAAMEAEKPALGLQPHEAHPKFFEFWNGYRETLAPLLENACSEKLLKRGYGGHCGCPAKFAYINEKCRISFTMKTAKKAVIETTNGTLDIYRRFTMKQSGDRWIWDDLQYSFDGKSWSNDSI
ncbi:MAG: hypothetical protein ACI4JT_09575 [Oscillospiraceae bacterium]